MDEKQQIRIGPTLVAGSIFLLIFLLTLYVAGYFWLGRSKTFFMTDDSDDITIAYSPFPGASEVTIRRFTYGWQVLIYRPAALVEAHIRGVEVELGTTSSGWLED